MGDDDTGMTRPPGAAVTSRAGALPHDGEHDGTRETWYEDGNGRTASRPPAASFPAAPIPAGQLPPAPDDELDRFAGLVHRLLGVSCALVTLVGSDRHVIAGTAGLAEPFSADQANLVLDSYALDVIATGRPVVVPDARQDRRARGPAGRVEVPVLAYAGMPLTDSRGRAIGTIGAIELVPREFSTADLATLGDLAAACSSALVRRELESRARAAERVATRATRQVRLLLRFSEAMVHTTTQDEVFTAVRALAHGALGATYGELAVGDQRAARFASVSDLPGVVAPRWFVVDAAADLPGPRAMRVGQTLLYPDGAALRTDFPRWPDAGPGEHSDGGADPTGAAAGAVGAVGAVGARAFLPLTAQGQPIGWLGLGWPAPRRMDDDVRELLASLARTTSQALQRAALIQQRREVAQTLQDALLSTLPVVPGLELAARYNPASAAEKVGGDWYDALALRRSTTLVIGDVTGHDVAAAAEMGHLRSILRGFAVDRDDSPSELLGRLDRANLALGSGTVATALVARLEVPGPAVPEAAGPGAAGPGPVASGGARLTWSSAGHYAPLLVHPDGRSAQLRGRSDLLLGVDGRATRTTWVDVVPLGSTLLLFTDGLVELRGQRIGERLELLRRAAAQVAGEPLDVMLDSLLGAMAHQHDQDDVAVLAARPVGPPTPAT